MIRSLFSAVSGLVNHQEAMDVIGNNIANVNTVGFKASSVNFAEAFSQTTRLADSSTPIGLSVGLGSRVQGTTIQFTQGAMETTSVPSDVAISGNGFFMANTQATTSGSTYYTRAGNFVVDVNGNLRTPDGYYVQGLTSSGGGAGFASTIGAGVAFVSNTIPSAIIATGSLSNVQIPTAGTFASGTSTVTESVVNYSIGTNGAITVVGQDGATATIGFIPLVTVNNDSGLTSAGGGYYQSRQASGTGAIYAAPQGGAGTLQRRRRLPILPNDHHPERLQRERQSHQRQRPNAPGSQ